MFERRGNHPIPLSLRPCFPLRSSASLCLPLRSSPFLCIPLRPSPSLCIPLRSYECLERFEGCSSTGGRDAPERLETEVALLRLAALEEPPDAFEGEGLRECE